MSLLWFKLLFLIQYYFHKLILCNYTSLYIFVCWYISYICIYIYLYICRFSTPSLWVLEIEGLDAVQACPEITISNTLLLNNIISSAGITRLYSSRHILYVYVYAHMCINKYSINLYIHRHIILNSYLFLNIDKGLIIILLWRNFYFYKEKRKGIYRLKDTIVKNK